jgi:porin
MPLAQTLPTFVRESIRVAALYCVATLAISTGLLLAHDGDAPTPLLADSAGERDKLTGNWFGVRDVWADQGFTFDTNLTQFYQGVAKGGQDQTFAYGGKVDYYLNLDGGKAMLCDGFQVSMHAETRYGEDVNTASGFFTFANFNMAFPKEGQATGITRLILSQSLSDDLVVFAGKINSLDDFVLNFTGRNGLERFMNSAMVANIINARTVPYSTYGTGFTVMRDEEPVFTFVVRDPDNHATTVDLNRLFAEGVLLSGTVKIPVAPFDFAGHQNFGFNWNSRSFTSVDPASFVIVPGQGIVAGRKSGSWALWYNFDQYLWVSESDPTVGWGIFGMTGLSDGNPNPIEWNTTLGISGYLVPGRQQDTIGIGYFHVGLSDEFKRLLSGPLAPPGLAQRDEQGVEMFYNASLARWCHLTFDMQFVEPSTRDLETAILVGARLKADF